MKCVLESSCPSDWRLYLYHVKRLEVYLLSLDGILVYRRFTPSRRYLFTHPGGERFCESAGTQQNDPCQGLNLDYSLPSPVLLPLRHRASLEMIINAHYVNRNDST